MANRLKEDERNEKIIRGLLKLPANRRCINCNNLGPQYVCTNFLTFICTACSGIHREFSHRVKSISMATFTSQEASALQEGGNERAKDIYFKEWDPQCHSFPDTSNVDKLRNFIKHVYVDRRFSGERSTHELQRVNRERILDNYAREDCNDSRREESHRGASRSPSNDERFCERFNSGGRDDDKSFRYAFGERSPGYVNGDKKRDARRFIVVDDRRRDVKFGNQRFENRRSLDEALKAERPSPDRRKEVGVTNLPTVRAIKEFFGDEPPLCVDDTSKSNNLRSPGYHVPKSNEARVLVSDTPKSNDTRLSVGKTPKSNDVGVLHNSQQTERLSGSSLGSCCENNVQSRTANTGSLIDFSTELEASAVPAMLQIVTKQTISSPAQEGDRASFDFMNQQKGHPTAANSTNLKAELAELSARALAFPGNMEILPICGNNSSPKATDEGKSSDIQKIQNSPSHSFFPIFRAQSAGQPSVESPAEAANDLSWESALAFSTQVSLTAPPPQHPSQAVSEIPLETNAGTLSQSHPSEAKSSGRKELPENLFTALYPSSPAPPIGWQRAPYPCMGYGIHYNLARPAFPNLPKPMNPFDLNSEPALSHASSYPSMASLEGVLPNMSGPALLCSSSFGSHSSAWTHQQQPTYPTTLSPSTYVAQCVPTNMPVPSKIVTMIHKKIVCPESEATLSGTPRSGQYSAATYCQPSMQNSFTPGGNPFV